MTSANGERLVTSAKLEGPREEKINEEFPSSLESPLIFQQRDVWVRGRKVVIKGIARERKQDRMRLYIAKSLVGSNYTVPRT